MSFLLGLASFFLSQILLRLPLLNLLTEEAFFQVLLKQHYLLMGLGLALSAGLFEETSRYLFRKFLLKNKSDYSQALIFGLGHGIMEALYILGPLVKVYPLSLLLPSLAERILAILIHMSLSLVIWRGFKQKKEEVFLLLAILIHGLIDFSIPLDSYFNSTALIYMLLLIQSLALFTYTSSILIKERKRP